MFFLEKCNKAELTLWKIDIFPDLPPNLVTLVLILVVGIYRTAYACMILDLSNELVFEVQSSIVKHELETMNLNYIRSYKNTLLY